MTVSVMMAAMFSLMVWALPAGQGRPLLQALAPEHLEPSNTGCVSSDSSDSGSSQSDESESETESQTSFRSRSRSRNHVRASAASSQISSGPGLWDC